MVEFVQKSHLKRPFGKDKSNSYRNGKNFKSQKARSCRRKAARG